MDTSEDQAKILLSGILKSLWNRGWGEPGYEWLRMNDTCVEDSTLSAAALLDANDTRLLDVTHSMTEEPLAAPLCIF